MMKALVIVVLFICIILIIVTIISAIKTAKRNAAKDEASAKVFLAGVNKDLAGQTERTIQPDPMSNFDRSIKTHKSTYDEFNDVFKKRELDYDTYEEEEIPLEAQGKKLSDFFG